MGTTTSENFLAKTTVSTTVNEYGTTTRLKTAGTLVLQISFLFNAKGDVCTLSTTGWPRRNAIDPASSSFWTPLCSSAYSSAVRPPPLAEVLRRRNTGNQSQAKNERYDQRGHVLGLCTWKKPRSGRSKTYPAVRTGRESPFKQKKVNLKAVLQLKRTT